MEYQEQIIESHQRPAAIDAASEKKAVRRVHQLYKSPNHDFTLLQGDCTELLPQFSFLFDMIFADPPYFLSNGGISVQSGKVVCVDKGDWDKGGSPEHIDRFNELWLSCCRDHLKDNGTIWVSGTYHNIFSVANKLTQLGFKILNVITWAKTNPPPNISCRYFTYSTEFVIWARKLPKVPHFYNYTLMKHLNADKQMTDVWRLPAIARWEKSQEKGGTGVARHRGRLPPSHQGHRRSRLPRIARLPRFQLFYGRSHTPHRPAVLRQLPLLHASLQI